MAETYAIITDGATTVTFADGAGGSTWWKIQDGWTPKVATVRESTLGGRGIYTDVVEEIPITISGSNAAHMYANALTLKNMLAGTVKWWYGSVWPVTASPVVFKYSPRNSTISGSASPMQATILRGADLRLSSGFNVSASGKIMQNATMILPRIGEWLHNVASGGSVAASNGEIVTSAFSAALSASGPTRIFATNVGQGKSTGEKYWGSFVLVSDAASSIVLLDAYTCSGGSYAAVSGSAQNARGGSVLRFSPGASGTEALSATGGSPALRSTCDLVSVFFNVRNSTTVNFQIRFRIESYLGTSYTKWNLVPAYASQRPLYYYAGTIPKTGAISGFYISASAGAASGSMDIGTIVLVDARATNVMSIEEDTQVGNVAEGTLDINHERLNRPMPSTIVNLRPIAAGGDNMLYTAAGSLYMCLLGTGDSGNVNGDKYRQSDSTTVFVNTWTPVRYASYLIPQ